MASHQFSYDFTVEDIFCALYDQTVVPLIEKDSTYTQLSVVALLFFVLAMGDVLWTIRLSAPASLFFQNVILAVLMTVTALSVIAKNVKKRIAGGNLLAFVIFSGVQAALLFPVNHIIPLVFLAFIIIAGIDIFGLLPTIMIIPVWGISVAYLGSYEVPWPPVPSASQGDKLRSLLYVAIGFLHVVWHSNVNAGFRNLQAQQISNLENSVRELAEANMSYNTFIQMAESQAARHERNRISRDIHDGVGYALTNLIMLSESAIDAASRSDSSTTKKQLNTIRNQARLALNDTRRALRELRASGEGLLYGVDAIKHMIDVYRQATGMNVTTHISVRPNSIDDELIFSVTYRFIQEAITNSFRHGHANTVEVRISLLEHFLQIVVTDNGGAVEPFDEGIGIQGMRERLGEVGGELGIHFIGGFTVSARIPLRVKNYPDE